MANSLNIPEPCSLCGYGCRPSDMEIIDGYDYCPYCQDALQRAFTAIETELPRNASVGQMLDSLKGYWHEHERSEALRAQREGEQPDPIDEGSN